MILVQLDCGKVLILDSHYFYLHTLPKTCRWKRIYIPTMLNDVARFTVIKREVARSYKNVWHPDSSL